MAALVESTLPIESAEVGVESPVENAGAILFLALVIVLVVLITTSAFCITRAQIRKRRLARVRPHAVYPLNNVATDAAPLPCLDCTIRIGAWHAARDRAGQPLDIEAGPQPCLGCRIRLGGWHAVRAYAARYAPGEHFEMVSYSTDARPEPTPATDSRSDATKTRPLREEDITESAQ